MPVKELTNSQRMILLKARRLLADPEINDLSCLSRVQDPVIYKGQLSHSRSSKHGGSPPREYAAAEDLVDLKLELEKEDPDFETITRSFFRLNCILRS